MFVAIVFRSGLIGVHHFPGRPDSKYIASESDNVGAEIRLNLLYKVISFIVLILLFILYEKSASLALRYRRHTARGTGLAFAIATFGTNFRTPSS
jgi:hypothetical protein